MARPSDYTQDMGTKICQEIALGSSIRTVCKLDGMPSVQTIFNWFKAYPDFLEQYTRATQERSEAMAEDIMDISDDGVNDWMEIHYGNDPNNTSWKVNNEAVQRSKLRVDTRKWLMSKMVPKKYGDKIDMTTNGKDLPVPIYNGNATKEL